LLRVPEFVYLVGSRSRCAAPSKAQLEALKAKEARSGTMSFKVSDKGGVSVYDLGRFPVTLYYEQWIKLLDRAQDLREFLEANKEKLKLKE
jgi:hypothetical protein